jgi:hypothetical protein
LAWSREKKNEKTAQKERTYNQFSVKCAKLTVLTRKQNDNFGPALFTRLIIVIIAVIINPLTGKIFSTIQHEERNLKSSRTTNYIY